MKSIKKRIEYLDKVIAENRGSVGSLGFFREERAALHWAVAKLTTVLSEEREIRDLARVAKT